MQSNMNNRAIELHRVSSRRQEGNTSHESQQAASREYAARVGLVVVKTFRIVESAKDSESRKKYNEAINWALIEGVRHILIHSHDRETRNLTDNERNEKLIREDRIVLHYVREGKAISKDSADSDFFMRDIQAATNKQFIRTLAGKVIEAQITKAKTGVFPVSRPPLGYVHEKLKDESGRELKRGTRVVPDPNYKRVQQVRREYELRAYQKLSLREIRRRIVEEGYLSPEEARRYHVAAIEKRLKNPFYTGTYQFRGECYEGNHSLIIPAEMARLVAQSFGGGTRGKGGAGLFSGFIRCAGCGCFIVYDPKRKVTKGTGETKIFPYYRCSNSKAVHDSQRGMNVPERELVAQFARAFDRITLDDEMAARISDALNDSHRETRRIRARQAEGYETALLSLERREDELYADMKRGMLSEEAYRRQLDRVREDRRRYSRLISEINEAIDDRFLTVAEEIIELSRDAKSLWLLQKPDVRARAVKSVVSNPTLAGRTLRFDYTKPFAALIRMKEVDGWRPGLDDLRTAILEKLAA